MPEAKFKILKSTELFPIRNNPNPEAIGMKYDVELHDADNIIVNYRVTVIEGNPDKWEIYDTRGNNIGPGSYLGKKIVDFIKLDAACKAFVNDDGIDQWFNEQDFN